MKALFWNPIAIVKENTIWQEFSNKQTDEQLNLEDLQVLFANKNVSSPTHVKIKPTTTQKQIVASILPDAKRLQNITIALKSFKQHGHEPKALLLALEDMNYSIINSETARTLLCISPTPEEIEMIKNFNG